MLPRLLVCITATSLLAVCQSVDLSDSTCRPTWEQTTSNTLLQHTVQLANVSGNQAVAKPKVDSPFDVLDLKCHKDRLGKSCAARASEYKRTLRNLRVDSANLPKPWFGTGEDLVNRTHAAYDSPLRQQGRGLLMFVPKFSWDAFESLRALDARHVLSFRETWTDADTELLKALDDSPNTYTRGRLTTEKFREYLPSIKVLEDLVGRNRSVAVVGGGPSVKDHGRDIDGHDVVVRFNNHVGAALNSVDTGLKMNMHVVNAVVDYEKEPGVLHIDLDSTGPGSSYCRRWYQAVGAPGTPWDQVPLMMRPSAVCGLKGIWGFTRGFLFYWLVGRLFDRVDLYGMSEGDGTSHYDPGKAVAESYIHFEHLLYSTARKMQDER